MLSPSTRCRQCAQGERGRAVDRHGAWMVLAHQQPLVCDVWTAGNSPCRGRQYHARTCQVCASGPLNGPPVIMLFLASSGRVWPLYPSAPCGASTRPHFPRPKSTTGYISGYRALQAYRASFSKNCQTSLLSPPGPLSPSSLHLLQQLDMSIYAPIGRQGGIYLANGARSVYPGQRDALGPCRAPWASFPAMALARGRFAGPVRRPGRPWGDFQPWG